MNINVQVDFLVYEFVCSWKK